jgi:hypothetical protein
MSVRDTAVEMNMEQKEEPRVKTLGAATKKQAGSLNWNPMILQYAVSVRLLILEIHSFTLQQYQINVKS